MRNSTRPRKATRNAHDRPAVMGQSSASAIDEVELLLHFGASMLRAGNTAARTREWIELVARKCGFDEVSVSLSLDSVTVSVRRAGEWGTAIREIGPPGINASAIAELEKLAKAVGRRFELREITAKLLEIDKAAPRYSNVQIAAAVGGASSSFAFLNGAGVSEMMAAAIGGCIGQWLRLWLFRQQLNHHSATAMSAVAASSVYVLAALLARHVGYQFAHYPAGFIASVLFLIPGFALIAALFDLLQYQTAAALSRLAYGAMILLAVAFGLSMVIAVAGIDDLSRQSPLEFTYPLKLLLRAISSFVAGGAFAMLFNCASRTVLAAGLLAMGANGLRLMLNDMGMMLAPAAFFAALFIGLVAVLADRCLEVARMTIIVAPIIIMIPGTYAFEMIVLANRGQMLEALSASASFGFVIGALAMGLATARLVPTCGNPSLRRPWPDLSTTVRAIVGLRANKPSKAQRTYFDRNKLRP